MPRNQETNTPAPAEATAPVTTPVETAPAPVTTVPATRARKPAAPKPANRSLSELTGVDPKKMTETEKILVINALVEDNNLLSNKFMNLEASFTTVVAQRDEVTKAYDVLRQEVSEKQNFVEATIRQAANTILLLGKVK